MSALEVWRSLAGETCACGAPLNFLEGPECDNCVTHPLPIGADKWWPYRDENRKPRESSEDDRETVGEDRIAFDLQTGEVVVDKR